IGVPVIVIIANRNSHVVSSTGQTGGIGHVGEDAVAIVAEEAVAEFGRVFCQGADIGAIGKENVGASVAVVVEDGNSAQHGLGHILGGSDAILQSEWNLLKLKLDGSAS